MKTVYVGMCADLIHHGHINIIEVARKYGDVTVGLLTDKAMVGYKRLPLLAFEHRKRIVENLKGVSKVIPQDSLDYVSNLKELRPDYLIHGTDWKKGVQKQTRQKAIDVMNEWGGKVIEPEYTPDLSSTKMIKAVIEKGTTPEIRMKKLKRLMDLKPIVRILEAHNGISGLIVEKTKIPDEKGVKEFDGIWVSSLTDSIAKGKPDTGCIDFTSRVNTINQIFEVTTKPMIVDADNGGLVEHFTHMVKTLERLGVSAVIIEDKVGAKRNSLLTDQTKNVQDTIENFSNKITEGKKSLVTDDFMIIARIESLILKNGMEDALKRAKEYIQAGADAIMIHSKEDNPKEILDFCEAFKNFQDKVPLIAVPSTYNKITEDELIDAGVNVVIYANHLMRSAYPSMVKTAETILTYGRCHEAHNEYCMPINDVLKLIPK